MAVGAACCFGAVAAPGAVAEPVSTTQTSVATPTADGWTQQFASTPSARSEADRVKVRYAPTTDLKPTGLYLPPNTELTITVKGVKKNDPNGVPKVSIGAPEAVADANGNKPKSRTTQLVPGKNTVKDALGGVVYIDYQSKTGTASTADITFGAVAKKMATFTRGETREADFQRELDRLDAPFVELYGNKAMITVARTALLKYRNENHNQLMAALDRIVTVENKFAGYDARNAASAPPAGKHHLIGFAGSVEGVAAYASNGYTIYPEPIQDNLLKVDGLRVYGFGPWHEVGHQHQQDPVLPGAVLEATVQTYALAVQRDFAEYGSTPRVRAVNSNGTSYWDDGMKLLADGVEDYGDVPYWNKVLPFEQLRLAYGESFFPTWHKVVRQQELLPISGEDVDGEAAQWQNIVYSTSLAAGEDLSDFWATWGVDVTDAARDQVDDAGLPDPRVDPSTLRETNINKPYYDDFPNGGSTPARATVGGADLGTLAPGEANEVTTTFTNRYGYTVYDVNMTLEVPEGWTAKAVTPSEFASVGSKAVTTTWEVTPPADAPMGEETLRTTVGWTAFNEQDSVSGQGTATVLQDDAIDQSEMSVAAVSSEETSGDDSPAAKAIDGDPDTFWHTRWSSNAPAFPHWIELDLGASYGVDGFSYLPRQDESNTRIKNYEIYVSADGESWGDPVATGSFVTGTAVSQVTFDAADGRYVRLVGLSSQNGAKFGGAAELGVYGEAVADN